MKQYTLKEIQAMPTISQSQTDDLKQEYELCGYPYRTWLSRMTKEDGQPYDNQVTIESFDNETGLWSTIETYEAK